MGEPFCPARPKTRPGPSPSQTGLAICLPISSTLNVEKCYRGAASGLTIETWHDEQTTCLHGVLQGASLPRSLPAAQRRG